MQDFTIFVNPAIPQIANVAALQAWCQGLTDYPMVHGQKFRLLDKQNNPLSVPNPTDPYDSADISAFVTVGQIAQSNASDVHTSLTIEIQDARLREAGVQLATLNSRIQAYLTYCDPRTIDPKTGKPTPLVVAPQFLGTLDIPDNQRQASGDILKIVCLDLTQEIAKRGFPVPFAFPAGTNLAADLRAFFMMDNRSPDDGGRQPSVPIRQILPPPLNPTASGGTAPTTTGPVSYVQSQAWTFASRTMPDTEVLLEDSTYALGPGVSSGAAVMPPASATYVDYATDISGFSFPGGAWSADISLSGQPYPTGAAKLRCTIYELKADGSRAPLGTISGTVGTTLGTAHTAPETDNISCTGTFGAFTAGQGSRFSAQYWLTVTSPVGAAATAGGTTGASVTEIFVVTSTNVSTPTPTQATAPSIDSTGTAGTGNGAGYTSLGFLVEDARSQCYETGETFSGQPLYAHPATVHADNGSGGFIRYLGGQGLKIEPGTGTVYSPAGTAYSGDFTVLDLVGGRIVWHFGDGGSFDWLETNPTTGSIWSGDPAAPTSEGSILGGAADTSGTATDTTNPNGNNVVAVNALTGQPFWPDANAPGLAPSGCPCPAANWPASKMQIASSDYVLPQALTYYTDANQIGAGKAIAALLRFEDPAADENGNLVMRPLPYSTNAIVAPEFLFDYSNPNIVVSISQRIASKDQLKNMVVIVSKNNTLPKPIISIAKNVSLDSQISIPNLNETIFDKVIQDDRIMSQAEADARAYVEINALALAADTVDVVLGAPFGFFRNNDLVGLNILSKDGRVEIDATFYPYIVSAWSLDLFSGACTFTAARRVRL
jgi:hypothetical protein